MSYSITTLFSPACQRRLLTVFILTFLIFYGTSFALSIIFTASREVFIMSLIVREYYYRTCYWTCYGTRITDRIDTITARVVSNARKNRTYTEMEISYCVARPSSVNSSHGQTPNVIVNKILLSTLFQSIFTFFHTCGISELVTCCLVIFPSPTIFLPRSK